MYEDSKYFESFINTEHASINYEYEENKIAHILHETNKKIRGNCVLRCEYEYVNAYIEVSPYPCVRICLPRDILICDTRYIVDVIIKRYLEHTRLWFVKE